MRVIIDSTTGVVSTPVPLTQRGPWDPSLPLTIAASGLSPGESVTIHFHDGDNWKDAYRNGTKMELNDTHNVEVLPGGLKWGVTKTATANAVKVIATQHYE
jgi:hypothetical protein